MFTRVRQEMGQILGVHAEPNHPATNWEPHAHFQLNVEQYVNENSSCCHLQISVSEETPNRNTYAEIKYTTIKC